MCTRNKMITLLLVFLMTVMSVLPVYAASNSQDGVSISVTTDRQKYDRNQTISVTVNVHNANAFAVENVTVETHTPSGYNFVGDVGTKNMTSLGANEAFQMNVSGNTTNLINAGAGSATQTGDHNGVVIWSILLVVALLGTVTLGIVYRKNRKGFLSLMLCLVMIAGLLPANMLQLFAANSNQVQTVSAYETIEVDGKQIEVGASVSFQFPGTDEEESSDDVSDGMNNDTTEDTNDNTTEEPNDNTTESTTPDTPESGDNTGEGGDNTGEGGDNTGEGGDNTGEGGDNTGEGGDNTGEGGDNTGEGDDDTSTCPENLFTGNYGFENDLSDWGQSSLYGASVVTSYEYSRTGNSSAYFSIAMDDVQTSAPVLSYLGAKEALEPGTEYTFMAWVRTEEAMQSANDNAGFQVYFRSSDTTASSQYHISQPAVADTEGKWQRVHINFTTKSDVAIPTGLFYIRLNAGTYGGVYIDDVALYKTAEVDFTAPDKEDDKGNMLENAYPENLLTGNGGFENGLTGWKDSNFTNWTVTANENYRRTGTGSALLTAPAENAPTTAVTYTYNDSRKALSPNTKYTLMAWVRTEAGKPLQTTVANGTPGITVYFNSSDTESKYNISQPVADTNGLWQRISVDFTTKADVTSPAGSIYIRMKEGTYGTVYLDDVALYETAKVNFNAPDKEEGLTSGTEEGGSGEGGNGDSGTTAPDYPENMLKDNTGFEAGLTGWSKNLYGASAEVSAAYSRTGSGSIYMSMEQANVQTGDPVLSYGGTRDALKPNTEYTFMAWIRTEEGKPLQTTKSNDTPGFQVYFNSSDTTVTKYNMNQPAVYDTEGKWQRVHVNFTTKPDVTVPTGKFYLRLRAGTYGGVYIDDVALYETAKVNFDAPSVEDDKGNMLENAYPTNLLKGNGGFEKGLNDWVTTKFPSWTVTSNLDYSRTGSGSALWNLPESKALTESVTMNYTGSKEALKPNTNYTLMAWVRTEEDAPLQTNDTDKGMQLYTKCRYYSNATEYVDDNKFSEKVYETDGNWKRIHANFTTKSEAELANMEFYIYLRFLKGTYGKIYIDDVALYETDKINFAAPSVEVDKGKNEVVAENILNKYPPLDATDNIFAGSTGETDNSFENVAVGGTPIGWAAYGGTWDANSMVQIVSGGYDGNNCVRIKTDSTEANPWIYKEDVAVVPGEKYVVSVWLKTEEVLGSGPRFKIECYDAVGNNMLSTQSEMFGITNGEWKQKGAIFTAPDNAVSVKIYMRMYGAGEIYYDKAEMYKYENASKILFEGDTFFYTEWGTGEVAVKMNEQAMTPTGAEVFDISLKTVPANENETATIVGTPVIGVTANTNPRFAIDLTQLEKGKEYKVEAVLYKSSGGAVLETASWSVYKYDRPSMINANGEIVINSQVITPVWGYHVYQAEENIEKAKAAGANIMQGGGASAATAKVYLDNCLNNGVYGTVILYSGMKAAASDGQRENALDIINAIKDHPALFGYLVMDEPYLHMSDPYNDLIESYRMIRELDTVHPIIIQDVEATGSTKYTAATSDILVMHHYGCNIKMMPTATEALDTEARYGMEGTTKVIRRMMSAFADTPITRKVVHYLGQSFGAATREEATGYYLPTVDEAKSMLYQALLEGMDGVGYYSFAETGWKLWENSTDLYNGMTAFAANEFPIVTEAYITDKHKADADKAYTILNEYRAIGDGYNTAIPEANKDDVWYSIFKENKDDGAWYVLAMNMGEGEKSAEITLSSKDSTETLGAYTGILMDGATTPVTVEGDGSLSIALAPHGTALYKLTEEAQKPQGPTNLLTGNVGFEENVSGWYIAKLTVGDKKWTFSHVDTIDRSENNVNMGCGELYATKEITPDVAVTLSYNNGNDMNNLVVGEEYVFSVWARMDEMLQSADSAITDIGMQLYISNGSKWYGSTEKETQGQWKQYTKVFTADATKPTLYIRIKGPAYGTIYIDDVALYLKSDYDAAQNQ